MSAIEVFANSRMAARFWMLLFLIALAAAIAGPYLTVEQMKQRDKVLVLDSAGTFTVSPSLGIEEAGKLQTYITDLAIWAFLNRSPSGLDNEELFKQLFASPALEDAKKIIEDEKDEFIAKGIHQKAERRSIKIVQSSPDLVVVDADGQIVRDLGLGQRVVEAYKFRISLTLIRNRNMKTNGRLPLAVWKMAFAIEGRPALSYFAPAPLAQVARHEAKQITLPVGLRANSLPAPLSKTHPPHRQGPTAPDRVFHPSLSLCWLGSNKFGRRDARGNPELSGFPLQTKHFLNYPTPAARRAGCSDETLLGREADEIQTKRRVYEK